MKKSATFFHLVKKSATFFHLVKKSTTFFHLVKKSNYFFSPDFIRIFQILPGQPRYGQKMAKNLLLPRVNFCFELVHSTIYY